MPVSTVLLLASIGVLSLSCQWLAWRVRMPAIVFLLAAGIACGPVLHYLNPEEVFGDLLFPMVSLAVAVILFEGEDYLACNVIHGAIIRVLLPELAQATHVHIKSIIRAYNCAGFIARSISSGFDGGGGAYVDWSGK